MEKFNIFDIKLDHNKTILQYLRRNNIYLSSPCNGKGTCGKCKIKVIKGSLPITSADQKYFSTNEIQQGYRLACQSKTTDAVTIKLCSNEDDFEILGFENSLGFKINTNYKYIKINLSTINFNDEYSLTEELNKHLDENFIYSLNALRKLSTLIIDNQLDTIFLVVFDNKVIDLQFKKESILGLAIDIGTTTIVIEVVDLITGRNLISHRTINRQRSFGADVISRIEYSIDDQKEQLNKTIINALIDGIMSLKNNYQINLNNIYDLVISGNTTMLHLLMNLDVESLGFSPYKSADLSLHTFKFHELFNSNILNAKVTILPGLSTFVGSDIVAGILVSNLHKHEHPSMLVDLGTNGEIVIGNKDKIIVSSTAAGPAFEAGNISCGIGSVPGAITEVSIENDNFDFKTINNLKPIGISGTGCISLLSSLLNNDLIDKMGKFEKDQIYLTENIYFNQSDIREIQLAKGAIRAGIECIIQEYNCSYDSIETIYLSGGFGNHSIIHDLINIGLFPEEFKGKIKTLGNSSLGGCIKYLLDPDQKNINLIKNRSQNINLSLNENFNDYFMDYMLF